MKRKTTKRERGGRERGKKRRKKRRERPVSTYGTVSNANGQRAFSLRLIGSRTRMTRATRMTRTSSDLPSVSCRRPPGGRNAFLPSQTMRTRLIVAIWTALRASREAGVAVEQPQDKLTGLNTGLDALLVERLRWQEPHPSDFGLRLDVQSIIGLTDLSSKRRRGKGE